MSRSRANSAGRRCPSVIGASRFDRLSKIGAGAFFFPAGLSRLSTPRDGESTFCEPVITLGETTTISGESGTKAGRGSSLVSTKASDTGRTPEAGGAASLAATGFE
jgi:hypothetical protein